MLSSKRCSKKGSFLPFEDVRLRKHIAMQTESYLRALWAKGLDASRYQGDINWALVESDGYKSAMIHASGPNNDRTGVEMGPV